MDIKLNYSISQPIYVIKFYYEYRKIQCPYCGHFHRPSQITAKIIACFKCHKKFMTTDFVIRDLDEISFINKISITQQYIEIKLNNGLIFLDSKSIEEDFKPGFIFFTDELMDSSHICNDDSFHVGIKKFHTTKEEAALEIVRAREEVLKIRRLE